MSFNFLTIKTFKVMRNYFKKFGRKRAPPTM